MVLCPWNFPGKNTGVGCHFILQGMLADASLPERCTIRYYGDQPVTGTQTVSFDPNGGTCATNAVPYEIGEPYGWLPEAERKLWTFDGCGRRRPAGSG